MIISKTPFRMSFFGGGTDIPSFFNEYGGAVISTTFDKFCYVNVRHIPRFFDYKNEIVYSKIEHTVDNDEINHPLVKNAMNMLDMHELRISYDADLPARSGLGTSSSFAVGMLNAFYALKGKYADKEKLAFETIKLERELCNEAGGWQDQIAASYGGLNRIDFKDNKFKVKPIIIHPERKELLNNNLLMFFTGFTRFSSEIQKANESKEDKVSKLKDMLVLVDKAEEILEDKHSDLNEFGKLLDDTWNLKRQTGNLVSNDSIDGLYKKGINAGALGGKLLGAGGGGFLLFYAPNDRHEEIKHALSDLIHIPFEFENGGTRIIYYSPEKYKE